MSTPSSTPSSSAQFNETTASNIRAAPPKPKPVATPADIEPREVVTAIPRRTYVTLDREYADESNNTFRWNICGPRDRLTTNPAVSSDIIRNFRRVRIQPFNVRVCENFAFWLDSVSILIHELSTDAYFAQKNSRKFHFNLYHGFNESPGTLTCMGSRANGDTYEFQSEVTTLETITISFGNPTDTLPLPTMIYRNCTETDGVGTITFTMPPGLHNTSGVTEVTIAGYTTADPVADAAIITSVNATHTTYTLALTGDTLTLELPFDGSIITPAASLPSMTITFRQRNFRITLEFD
jgi:hypothetical protein